LPALALDLGTPWDSCVHGPAFLSKPSIRSKASCADRSLENVASAVTSVGTVSGLMQSVKVHGFSSKKLQYNKSKQQVGDTSTSVRLNVRLPDQSSSREREWSPAIYKSRARGHAAVGKLPSLQYTGSCPALCALNTESQLISPKKETRTRGDDQRKHCVQQSECQVTEVEVADSFILDPDMQNNTIGLIKQHDDVDLPFVALTAPSFEDADEAEHFNDDEDDDLPFFFMPFPMT